MAIEIINVGASANDGNGDPIRDAFIKCNDNFDELETTKINGSGTDDYIPKFNGPDAIENSQIFDNGTNVGIGTTSPSEKLQIYSSSNTAFSVVDSASSIRMITAGGINFFQSGPVGGGASPLVFSSMFGGLEYMRITSSGNVGIGTTNPTASAGYNTLSVNGSSGGQITLQTGNAIKGYIYNTSTSLVVGADLGNALVLDAGNTERMRITSSGNVGIGTTAPQAKLHINNGTNRNLWFRDNGSGTGTELLSINDAQSSRQSLAFSASSFYFDNGNVGIGTTAPSEKLVVGGSSGAATTPTAIRLDDTYRTGGDAFDKLKFYLYKSSTETYGFGLGDLGDIQYWAGTNSTGNHRFFTSQTERLRITSSGNVGIGTTSPSNAKFVVSGSSASGSIMSVDTSSTTSFIRLLGDIASQNLFNWQNGTDLRFATSNQDYSSFAERMRITSSGNVGIGLTNPSSSAILHLKSNSQGFLPPVMRTGDRNSISSPAIGLVIFNEDSQTIEVYTTAGWKSLLYI